MSFARRVPVNLHDAPVISEWHTGAHIRPQGATCFFSFSGVPGVANFYGLNV